MMLLAIIIAAVITGLVLLAHWLNWRPTIQEDDDERAW